MKLVGRLRGAAKGARRRLTVAALAATLLPALIATVGGAPT
ncbi:diacylglycerol acyltransferase/mycolyltransferase Ag85A, partial [Mycobacterium sp. ITM-2017-0098]